MKFRAAQQEIAVLNARAKAGEMVLAYADEAGFECVHPNRSAWTDRGQVHEIEATRGKRLNVIAAMLSTGQGNCTTVSIRNKPIRWLMQTFTATRSSGQRASPGSRGSRRPACA